MNILIKLMSIVSLVIAPSLAMMNAHAGEGQMGQNINQEKNMFAKDVNTSATPETKTITNSPYTAFIAALETDGLFDEKSTSIVVHHGQVAIDGKILDQEVAEKYLPLLNGETDLELHFDPSK